LSGFPYVYLFFPPKPYRRLDEIQGNQVIGFFKRYPKPRNVSISFTSKDRLLSTLCGITSWFDPLAPHNHVSFQPSRAISQLGCGMYSTVPCSLTRSIQPWCCAWRSELRSAAKSIGFIWGITPQQISF
jgi:hypothetical protein